MSQEAARRLLARAALKPAKRFDSADYYMTKYTSQRSRDSARRGLEQLRQQAIAEQLKIREEVGAERFDAQFNKPTPPKRSELCKRVLQKALRSMAASPGGVTVDV